MITPPRAILIGGGIGSLAAAAFMIRDGRSQAKTSRSSKPCRSWAAAWTRR